MKSDRAADPSLRNHPRLFVEMHAEQPAGLEKEGVTEPLQAPGPILLGDAQKDGDGPGRHIRDLVKTLPQRARKQADELGDAAPGLFQRHLAADDPLATTCDETGLPKIVDGAADRRAGRFGGKPDTG